MKASAFCPGHVTGFFEICPSADILSMGSRGAGMCISLGATSTISAKKETRQKIAIELNGKTANAQVTRTAVKYLLLDRPLSVKISTVLELPQSQGFGMSAAGSLSAAIALADILGEPRQKAFEAAHIAEIRCGGGLGDISALHRGGVTVRERPGLPPRGKVLRIRGKPQLVLAVVGRRILTKSVLSDSRARSAINRAGARRVKELIARPSLENLMTLSASFALDSQLASREVRVAMSAASKLGSASMAMLGNSVFALGDIDSIAQVLSDFGETFRCRVDVEGPRLI